MNPYNSFILRISSSGYFSELRVLFHKTIEHYYFSKAHNKFICFFLKFGLANDPDFLFAFNKKAIQKVKQKFNLKNFFKHIFGIDKLAKFLEARNLAKEEEIYRKQEEYNALQAAALPTA